MKRILVCLMAGLLVAGCATQGREQYTRRVTMEVGRLQEPLEPFSTYGRFKLADLVLADEIRQQPEKLRIAQDFERKLKDRLQPLLQEWDGKGKTAGTLVITPKLHHLYVVSPGARFWLGLWSGSSRLGLDLDIRDEQTGKTVARPRIDLTADANTGAWSVGASDRNMMNYAVDIAYEYLKKNY